ncbi:sugar phosphate nucleotidyltransferase [Litorivicinus sp.]|nr:sugar phosphate nucleotidyltransferase [Litorivicinus sp.]
MIVRLGEWKKHCISGDKSIESTLLWMNELGIRFALIVDDNEALVGTITDGDIRRLIVGRQFEPHKEIRLICNYQPIIALESQSIPEILPLFIGRKIDFVPIVDQSRKVVGLWTVIVPSGAACKVLIMAGGFGKRMGSLTTRRPKPLIKVTEKSMIESLIRQFAQEGFFDFLVSTHYQHQKVVRHVNSVIKNLEICSVRFLIEDEPLGTAGALGLAKDWLSSDECLIVCNGDLVSDVRLSELLMTHLSGNADITVSLRRDTFKYQYGSADVLDDDVVHMVEKPDLKFLQNMGIYCLSANVMSDFPQNTTIDMPTFINDKLNQGYKVKAYFHKGYWIDVGTPEKLRLAKEFLGKES